MVTSTAAIASSRWRSLVAPTTGAVTAGLPSSQASAIWAGGRPRSAATVRTTSTTSKSSSLYISSASGSLAARTVRCSPPRQRAPGDASDALVEAEREHLPLLLAVDQVVVVLHRGEPGPPTRRGGVLGLGELPGVHARRAEVAGLAGPHDVVEGPHRLLDRGLVVPAVDLVEVDVVGPQPVQRGVDGGQDVLARQPAVVGTRAHRVVDLGRQHVVVTAPEQLGEQPAGDLL